MSPFSIESIINLFLVKAALQNTFFIVKSFFSNKKSGVFEHNNKPPKKKIREKKKSRCVQIYSLNKKTQILNNDEHLAPKACMYVFFFSRRQARRLYKILFLFHLHYTCCFFVNNNNLSISAAYFQCSC